MLQIANQETIKNRLSTGFFTKIDDYTNQSWILYFNCGLQH